MTIGGVPPQLINHGLLIRGWHYWWWSTIKMCVVADFRQTQVYQLFWCENQARAVPGFRSTAKQAERVLWVPGLQLHLGDTLPRHTPHRTESQKEDVSSTGTTLPIQGFQSNHQFRPQSALRVWSFRDFSFGGLFPTCARWLSQSAGSCQLTKLTLT